MIWTSTRIADLCQSKQVYKDALEMRPFFRSMTQKISGSATKLQVILRTFEDESVEVTVAGSVISCQFCECKGPLCVHGALVAISLLLPKRSPLWTFEKVRKMCITDIVYFEAVEMGPLFKSMVDSVTGSGSSLIVQLRTYENDSVRVQVLKDIVSCDYCLSSGPLCVHGALVVISLLSAKKVPVAPIRLVRHF